MPVYRLSVTGMSCAHCEAAVREALAAIDPAARVEIDLPTGCVEIESSEPVDRLAAAIEAEGYSVSPSSS
ncbi:MAG: heavy-metal-associated domain-containing protein [Casimicrobiaceae bacterium]|nr:heavy-metal-associated domain-containing protein [Casimicrobiaceae bacterium]MDW8312251.1 heavy-metal-associated domain-containing protein [Burkholderiales bacterium]